MNDFSKRRMTIKELFSKEVINVHTAERLGYICDAEVDLECGQICLFYLPSSSKSLFQKKKDMRAFSFCDIQKIGKDTILIKTSGRDIVVSSEKQKKSCKTN